jgi:hypothetical protein
VDIDWAGYFYDRYYGRRPVGEEPFASINILVAGLEFGDKSLHFYLLDWFGHVVCHLTGGRD